MSRLWQALMGILERAAGDPVALVGTFCFVGFLAFAAAGWFIPLGVILFVVACILGWLHRQEEKGMRPR